MRDSKKRYFHERAAQEKALADEAEDETVRAIHLKLAHECTMRAQRGEGDDRPSNYVFTATSVGDQSS